MKKLLRDRYAVTEITHLLGFSVPDVLALGEGGQLPIYAFASNWDAKNSTGAILTVRGLFRLDLLDVEEAACNTSVIVRRATLEDGTTIDFVEDHEVTFGKLHVKSRELEDFVSTNDLFSEQEISLVEKVQQNEVRQRDLTNLKITIGLIVHVLVKAKGSSHLNGGKPNVNRVVKDIELPNLCQMAINVVFLEFTGFII